MERLNPYLDHRLEITFRDNRMIIRKKKAWREDPEIVELYEQRAGSIIAGDAIPVIHLSFMCGTTGRDPSIMCSSIRKWTLLGKHPSV